MSDVGLSGSLTSGCSTVSCGSVPGIRPLQVGGNSLLRAFLRAYPGAAVTVTTLLRVLSDTWSAFSARVCVLCVCIETALGIESGVLRKENWQGSEVKATSSAPHDAKN